jgi:predicted DsbA family dithiol-disulfide isomerase
MTEPVLAIDVYSDVICPWCYVGKRRLEQALQQVGDPENVEVRWRPFQLNPTMPKEGMDRRAYLEAKFGTVEAYGPLEEQVSEAGSAEGISFAFEKITRTPNTFLAHRLIWYAGQQSCQDALVGSLSKGFFEEGADLGSAEVLAQLAERVGLRAETFLQGDEGAADVKSEEEMSRRLGVRAVPYFVLNHAYGISGAQPAKVLVAAIEKGQDARERSVDRKEVNDGRSSLWV